MTAVPLPPALREALTSESWKDPGPEALRRALGLSEQEGPLELLETPREMQDVLNQVIASNYPELPWFGMVRSSTELAGEDDPRVALDRVVFLAVSRYPGDDVFAVLDLSRSARAQTVWVLDWPAQGPSRWRPALPVEAFVSMVAGS